MTPTNISISHSECYEWKAEHSMKHYNTGPHLNMCNSKVSAISVVLNWLNAVWHRQCLCCASLYISFFFQLLIVINVSPTHTLPFQCHGTLDMSPYSSISHLNKVTHILLLLVVITVLATNVMYLLTTC